ncbi:hypothetical protein FRC02_009254 [Tulasnella sp. 418]|nr:hypothetical protein FRC02_009254 [Tulasnella sp. 418]
MSSGQAIQIIGLSAVLLATLKGAGKLVREKVLIPTLTPLEDVQHLGEPRKGEKLKGTVVVAGGSIAGLYAASVCADHFENVIVVEPDRWVSDHGTTLDDQSNTHTSTGGTPKSSSGRSRVMQYNLVHMFHPPSLTAFEKLFPTEFENGLDHIGAKPVPMELYHYIDGIHIGLPFKQLGRSEETPKHLLISRAAFEILLRRCLKTTRSNVKFIVGTVIGLSISEKANAVNQVFIRTDCGEIEQSATLVIDATGSDQAGFHKWLPRAKVPLPSSLRVEYNPKMYYTTTSFSIPKHLQSSIPLPRPFSNAQVYNTLVLRKETRTIFFGIVERDTLLITCGGWNVSERPHSFDEYRAYVSSLDFMEPVPKWVFALFDFLEEHADEVNPRWNDANVGPLYWVQYHKALDVVPSNFIAVGDASMKLNPIFGQGCFKALSDAATLDALLRKTPGSTVPTSFSSSFFKKQKARIETMWSGTRTQDYGFPDTIPVAGESLSDGALMREYSKQVLALTRVNAKANHLVWHVNMLIAPVTDLFSPWLVGKVLWQWLTGGSRDDIVTSRARKLQGLA